MAKSADAFRTISEVAEWLDTPAHVLRFWESKFTQVKPVKRAGGRRYYRPQDMRLLGGIKKLLHDDGMTIKGVQKLLRDNGIKHVSSLSPPLAGEEDTAYTHVPGPETPETGAPEPARVLNFRPRSDDPAPEPTPPAEPEPPRRDFALTHSVPRKPPQDPAPEDSASGDNTPPPAEDESRPSLQEPGPDTPPAEADTEMDDMAQATPDPDDRPEQQTAPDPDDTSAPDPDDTSTPDPDAPPAPDPALDPPVKSGLPAFLSRPPAEIGSPVDEEGTEPPADTPEPLAPGTPRAPLTVDVPDDPADDAFASPGPITVLAEVPRPFQGYIIKAIRPLAQRLRKTLDETDQD
ncbi:MAG: MerR family transcriptional regulator [Roseovarius sp.]